MPRLREYALTLGSIIGLLVVYGTRRELGWLWAAVIFGSLFFGLIAVTSVHCYLRLYRGGIPRREAARRCLEWWTIKSR